MDNTDRQWFIAFNPKFKERCLHNEECPEFSPKLGHVVPALILAEEGVIEIDDEETEFQVIAVLDYHTREFLNSLWGHNDEVHAALLKQCMLLIEKSAVEVGKWYSNL